jgi:hypothetical protein
MDQIPISLSDLPLEPYLVLAGLLALLHASVYGFIFGPSLLRYPMFIIVSAIGVSAGQLIGELAGLSIGLVGDLHIVTASIGAWLLLIIAKRLGA